MYNEKLLTFIAVVENGSFSKAADQLYKTPVSIMNQINSLEEHFELKLIKRTPRGIKLTKEGQIIYRESKKLVQKSEKFLASLHLQNEPKKIEINIGLDKMDYLSPFTQDLRLINNNSQFVHVNIRMLRKSITSEATLKEQLNQQYDCIYAREERINSKTLKYQHLQDNNVLFLVPIDSSLSRKNEIKMNDLNNQKIVIQEKFKHTKLYDCCEMLSQKVSCKIRYTKEPYGISLYSKCVEREELLLLPNSLSETYPFLKEVQFSPRFKISSGLYYKDTNKQLVQKLLDEYAKINILNS